MVIIGINSNEILQILTIQKDLHFQFIAWVKKRRGKRLKANDEVLFNAGVWSGSKAKELGLIDGIGDYYNVMKNIFGDDIKFKDFSKKTSWFKQKFLSNGSFFNKRFSLYRLFVYVQLQRSGSYIKPCRDLTDIYSLSTF